MDRPPVPAPRNRRPAAPLPPPDEDSLPLPTTVEEGHAAQFHRLYKAAYVSTTEGQNLDADGLKEQAFKAYEKALLCIDDAVALAHQGGFPNTEVNRIDELTFKIRLTRKEILERISDLQGSSSDAMEEYLQGPTAAENNAGRMDLPPAYSEIANPGEAMVNPYCSLAVVLNEISSEQSTLANPLPIHAREVFSLPENIQIYFISAEDNVSAPTYPSFLRLVVMEQEGGEMGVVTASVPAFLQVGDWTYPLIPRHSPVFRSTDGIYMFPDLTTSVPGSYVGLLLPEDIPAERRQGFENTLLQLLGFEQFPEPVKPESPVEVKKAAPEIPRRPSVPPVVPIPAERRFSTKIAEGLMTGAEAVSRGLMTGATKASGYIDKGAAFLQSKIEPAKENSTIKPEYRKGMKTAKTVTGKAVKVSGYVVTQIGHATMALGRHLAPHVHKASTKILEKTLAHDETDASHKVDQVLEVTSGAIYGVGTVYFGLENAASVLARSLSNNTVQIVQHKYGAEAGEFATDTAATAGNAALTAWNAKNLAPKAIVKKGAKKAGKMVLMHHVEKKDPGPGGPPDNFPGPAGGAPIK